MFSFTGTNMQSFCSPSHSLRQSPTVSETIDEGTLNKTDTSILSVLANQFVSEASNIPKRLYCPFCLFDFGFDYLLKSHIHDSHVLEIKRFSETKLDSFTSDPCCFCHAKFYTRGLLPKHIIRKHQECILALVSVVTNDQNACCKFCAYKISFKKLKLLFIHLENKHLNEFVKILAVYNLKINAPTQEHDTSVDGVLNEEIQRLSIASGSKKIETMDALKPILKRGSLYDELAAGTSNENWAPSTRRKLRFDLPDLSVSSNGSDKENVATSPVTRRIFGLKVKKKPKPRLITPNKIKPVQERPVLQDITASALENFSPSDDGVDNLEVTPFRCGVCWEGFECNGILVKHVKKIHGRINLHPRYRCGLCKAKFFRNSYLVRHAKLHAKPKCLTSYEYKPLI